MRNDIYTKAVLTVIAIMLSVIAFRPIVSPGTTARAQEGFSGMQLGVASEGPKFFDARTGDYWSYGYTGQFLDHQKMTKSGAPLTQVK